MKGFRGLWSSLFLTPVHLDSAISKLPGNLKSTLAQIVPGILLRPVSQAEALGIGVQPGEPWGLSPEKLARWRPAELMADRVYESMVSGAVSAIPVREDFPESMIAQWERAFGKEVSGRLVDVLGREPPLSLRAARAVGSRVLLEGLRKECRLPVRAERSGLSPFGVRLSGYAPVLGSEWHEKGAFEIQDEGSQLMALFALWPELYGSMLGSRPGLVPRMEEGPPHPPADPAPWTVVDACAGAGGKSLALADALLGRGRVFAYDVSAPKLQALRRRASRAGLRNIQAIRLEEGREDEVIRRFRRTAHAVLVDAPCSGWGVLRRNPDIKWRQTGEAIGRMPPIQSRLLSLYSELVAPGGHVVYGVCTFRPEETDDVVEDFLRTHPDFEKGPGGYLGPGPSDGFFMRALVRKEGTARS